MSSGICLIGILLFSITGITLNHAGAIMGNVVVETVERDLPPDLLIALKNIRPGGQPRLPLALTNWAERELDINLANQTPEWSDEELYVPLPRPGGDGWLAIDLSNGAVVHENTARGWVAWLNDLHKGRDTGQAWSWFIDIFAVACVIFSLTGFFLLQLHARRRPFTWPIVGAGLAIPLILIIFTMHR